MRSPLLVAVVLVGLAVIVTPAVAREHVLLAMPGVAGASSIPGYETWCEMADFVYEVPGVPPLLELAAGNEPDKIEGLLPLGPTPLVLLRPYDKFSPKLMAYCRSGTRFGPVRLLLCSTTEGGTVPRMQYELRDVLVTSYEVFAPGFGDRVGLTPVPSNRPMELLRVLPKSISWKWIPKSVPGR